MRNAQETKKWGNEKHKPQTTTKKKNKTNNAEFLTANGNTHIEAMTKDSVAFLLFRQTLVLNGMVNLIGQNKKRKNKGKNRNLRLVLEGTKMFELLL